MPDFIWTEKLTVDALKTLEHSTWSVINPHDMLHAIEKIQQSDGEVTSDEIEQIREELKIKHEDFRQCLKHLELITAVADGTWQITDKPSRPGFYSGKELTEVIKDVGATSPQSLNVLGHNYILHARESLPFCSLLMEPGMPKDYLKEILVDRYLFNQKINSFKFDNLIGNLVRFEVIKESESGFVVDHAPPVLSFYQITSSYLFLASNNVGRKVNSDDLQREVHSLLPNREEDYTVLGFDQFPIEGWGKHQAWMTPESFTRMLQIGLIDPLCIARILKNIVQDKTNPSNELAKLSLRQLKNKIINDVHNFRGDPINLPEVLQEFELFNTSP